MYTFTLEKSQRKIRGCIILPPGNEIYFVARRDYYFHDAHSYKLYTFFVPSKNKHWQKKEKKKQPKGK